MNLKKKQFSVDETYSKIGSTPIKRNVLEFIPNIHTGIVFLDIDAIFGRVERAINLARYASLITYWLGMNHPLAIFVQDGLPAVVLVKKGLNFFGEELRISKLN